MLIPEDFDIPVYRAVKRSILDRAIDEYFERQAESVLNSSFSGQPETKQSEQEARGLPLPGGTSFPPEAGAASCSELVGFGDSGSSGVPGNGSTVSEADCKEE